MQNEISVKVQVNLTANEWELYTAGMRCETAATRLNTAATKAINEAHKVYKATHNAKEAAKAAWGIWSPVSDALSSYGAADTEPRWHFDNLLITMFYKPLDLKYDGF